MLFYRKAPRTTSRNWCSINLNCYSKIICALLLRWVERRDLQRCHPLLTSKVNFKLKITLINCASNQHKINDTRKWKSCDNNKNSKSNQFCICSCDIFLTFEFVDEIGKYYCSVESNWVVTSRANTCFSSFCKFNYWKLVKVLKLRLRSFVRSLIVNGECKN